MDYSPIPGPRGLPILGNLLDLRDPEAPLHAMGRLADTYGPIYELNVGGEKRLMVSSAEMMKEVMDEKRFIKLGVLPLIRPGRPNGVIVASTLDPDWEQGHRILRPVSEPRSSLEHCFR